MTAQKLTQARILIAPLAALAIAAAAPAAEATEVPPGNSAANQYTEAYPGSGGEQLSEDRKTDAKPAEVLGEKNARKLESQGPEGEAAARVATETSAQPPGGLGGTAEGSPGDSSGAPDAPGGGGSRTGSGDASSDSDGLGDAVGQAFGVRPGEGGGLLVPLAILAAITGSLAFLWKRKRPAQKRPT